MSRHRRRQARGDQVHDGDVLHDADRSLASWLGQVLPPGTGLRFDAPTARWVTDPPERLFVDLFLLGVRQDPRGRESGWADLRDEGGRVVGRQPPPQYFRLNYLVTAWASGQDRAASASDRTLAEHELLGLVLSATAYQSVLPGDCLAGPLAETGLTVALDCAPQEPGSAGTSWVGLGIAPRACLELVLILPARPPVLPDIAPPAREVALNAAQRPGSARPAPSAGPQVSVPSPHRPRRWQKETITELPAASDNSPG